jgi:LytS/YehU family sensor histidine kinase
MEAEINVLRNELDPHFVYNSLMPLYYLVKNDIHKAEAFACKLIQVYQYFLENRQNDFITLKEELNFIDNYFFLLQIRYKDSVLLKQNITEDENRCMVLPLSLQILVENVIKHNEFTREEPLTISITSERNCLVVTNSLRSKTYSASTSRIGLKNLRSRYRILASKDISVMKNKDQFIVKIPLLRNTKAYDVNRYHRG